MLKTYSEYEGSDIEPRLAVSLPRNNPWPDWEVTKEVALGAYGHLLTGIDFCYLEEGRPPKEQRELFEAVKDFNRMHPERALAILYHVGESFSDKSLESAVRWVHEAAELGPTASVMLSPWASTRTSMVNTAATRALRNGLIS